MFNIFKIINFNSNSEQVTQTPYFTEQNGKNKKNKYYPFYFRYFILSRIFFTFYMQSSETSAWISSAKCS
jgi:hypothetical protein